MSLQIYLLFSECISLKALKSIMNQWNKMSQNSGAKHARHKYLHRSIIFLLHYSGCGELKHLESTTSHVTHYHSISTTPLPCPGLSNSRGHYITNPNNALGFLLEIPPNCLAQPFENQVLQSTFLLPKWLAFHDPPTNHGPNPKTTRQFSASKNSPAAFQIIFTQLQLLRPRKESTNDSPHLWKHQKWVRTNQKIEINKLIVTNYYWYILKWISNPANPPQHDPNSAAAHCSLFSAQALAPHEISGCEKSLQRPGCLGVREKWCRKHIYQWSTCQGVFMFFAVFRKALLKYRHRGMECLTLLVATTRVPYQNCKSDDVCFIHEDLIGVVHLLFSVPFSSKNNFKPKTSNRDPSPFQQHAWLLSRNHQF